MTELDTAAPPEPTEGQRITAKGYPITLTDGREVRLRFGMAAILQLEEDFGSLGAVQEALKNLTPQGRVFGPVVDLLAAGLSHHGITRAELIGGDLLALDGLEHYAEQLGRAFAEAFPSMKVGGQGNVQGPAVSRGASGTTSARSSSAAPRKRSGR